MEDLKEELVDERLTLVEALKAAVGSEEWRAAIDLAIDLCELDAQMAVINENEDEFEDDGDF